MVVTANKLNICFFLRAVWMSDQLLSSCSPTVFL